MSDVIAWLVPTASSTPSSRAAHLPANAHLRVPVSTTPCLSSSLADTSFLSMPSHALQLTFSTRPKQPGRLVLGTDPLTCDVVLPAGDPLTPGAVSPRHCSLTFDADARLVLNDFSERGTQVWYDWESKGDQTDHAWVLSPGASSPGGFPSQVGKITLDLQGVRFQVVVPDRAAHWDEFKRKVDSFRDAAAPSLSESLTCGAWDKISMAPVLPLCTEGPLYHYLYVKALGQDAVGEFYLWNLAKPWEALVKATA